MDELNSRSAGLGETLVERYQTNHFMSVNRSHLVTAPDEAGGVDTTRADRLYEP